MLTKKELAQLFVLGWHFNYDNVVLLRDRCLTLYAELEKAETIITKLKAERDGLCDDCRLQNCPDCKTGRPQTALVVNMPGVFIGLSLIHI